MLEITSRPQARVSQKWTFHGLTYPIPKLNGIMKNNFYGVIWSFYRHERKDSIRF